MKVNGETVATLTVTQSEYTFYATKGTYSYEITSPVSDKIKEEGTVLLDDSSQQEVIIPDQKMGHILFYTERKLKSPLLIEVAGEQRTLRQHITVRKTGRPQCGRRDGSTFYLPEGEYLFTARNRKRTYSGQIVIQANRCSKMRLD